MARGKIGSWVGTPVAGRDLLPTLAQGKTSEPRATGFGISAIAISGDPGLRFTLNDAVIELTDTGIFETAEGMIEVKRLVFETASPVNIRYLY